MLRTRIQCTQGPQFQLTLNLRLRNDTQCQLILILEVVFRLNHYLKLWLSKGLFYIPILHFSLNGPASASSTLFGYRSRFSLNSPRTLSFLMTLFIKEIFSKARATSPQEGVDSTYSLYHRYRPQRLISSYQDPTTFIIQPCLSLAGAGTFLGGTRCGTLVGSGTYLAFIKMKDLSQ